MAKNAVTEAHSYWFPLLKSV